MQTHRLMRGIYKYAYEVSSGAMIHISGFIKTELGILLLIWSFQRHTDNTEIA
jgi:hypothetical protein